MPKYPQVVVAVTEQYLGSGGTYREGTIAFLAAAPKTQSLMSRWVVVSMVGSRAQCIPREPVSLFYRGTNAGLERVSAIIFQALWGNWF